jgi:Second Messenger Oligonucleotide or Dinucleotide Synthetase domain
VRRRCWGVHWFQLIALCRSGCTFGSASPAITPTQREDAETKRAGVGACLNRSYWCTSSGTANSILIGSWGKQTYVRPPRDVDIVFLLSPDVYHRFQARSGNRQSQLLQEVKDVLVQTYSATTMRADGQVVMVPFNSTSIEVATGFRCSDGSIIVCDINNGGSYKTSTAEAEARGLTASDAKWNGNTRALIRMLKQWQRECNVPLKSFQIERLAVAFLETWASSCRDVFWYDWMVRDFFSCLISWTNHNLIMPGTGEPIPLGRDWQSRAQTAYHYAYKACEYERDNLDSLAGQAWQKIFGIAIPMSIS